MSTDDRQKKRFFTYIFSRKNERTREKTRTRISRKLEKRYHKILLYYNCMRRDFSYHALFNILLKCLI